MKLYKIANALAGERWHSARTGLKDFVEIELPKDGRAGMAKLFNDNEQEVTNLVLTVNNKIVGVGAGPAPIDPLEAAELRAVAAAKRDTAPPQLTADTVVAFILDDATVAQTCAIFEALGSRFKEIINGAR